MQEREKIQAELQYVVKLYSDLVELLLAKMNHDGVSRISHADMARHVGLPKKDFSMMLQKYINFGLIEKTGFAAYRVIHTDMMKTSLAAIFDLLDTIDSHPGLSYQQQAKELGVTEKELGNIYGSLVYLLQG
ncbi:hypothetical protein PAESOLCIP111_01232 [Paenibacillus solanacearum]|uniref:Uncharacterized protein n=1 Tax=Paenibacillus solanacearum TaxID=2048548 RepID=A0A916JZS6_9BACL|nr:hypothetical protein [Paenibacillus solanacearum]CAG7610371.1 hypothetical protein PAESOLCIP111_01232 [Paenibacillus solanacearum]